jgi:hypothetical protein
MKISNTEKRALAILLSGPIVYHVSGSKATDWDKQNWKFNIATLRALRELSLADYTIYASCERTWTITEEGTQLCMELGLLSLASS